MMPNGDKLRNLEENCKSLSPDKDHQSCSSCVRSWREIKGTASGKNGEPDQDESDVCRFAVLVSLTSSRIKDQQSITKINECLGKMGGDRDIEPEKSTGNKKPRPALKYAVIGSIVGILVIAIFTVLILLRRRQKSVKPKEDGILKFNSVSTTTEAPRCVLPEKSGYLKFSMREVYAATNNLHESNFIGEGTAGRVYKGLLSNKQHVAVKHIFNEQNVETFLREVRNLSRVRHPNLVALLGYCVNEDDFFLVYELCPNGNLSQWLFGKDKVLSWIQRLELAIDSARGLWFLHTYREGCIVHRDIKPTNILLGINFEAKLSDFGLSKVIDLGESYASSEVRGTFGYVDPEYQSNRQVNSSGDVYSFGIVLLQIISGKKVINMNLKKPMPLSKMAKSLTRGSIVEFADPKLDGEFSSEAFDSIFNLALSCTALKNHRPSMEQVVLTLEEALHISTSVDVSHSRSHTIPD